MTGEAAAARGPDSVVTWESYLVSFQAVCDALGIRVGPHDEIEADIPDKGQLRFIVKGIS